MRRNQALAFLLTAAPVAPLLLRPLLRHGKESHILCTRLAPAVVYRPVAAHSLRAMAFLPLWFAVLRCAFRSLRCGAELSRGRVASLSRIGAASAATAFSCGVHTAGVGRAVRRLGRPLDVRQVLALRVLRCAALHCPRHTSSRNHGPFHTACPEPPIQPIRPRVVAACGAEEAVHSLLPNKCAQVCPFDALGFAAACGCAVSHCPGGTLR